MIKKLLMVVPYRNRQEHLTKFIEYIIPTIENQKIKSKIVIVEQDDNNLFNRGLLCNIGFLSNFKNNDYVCFHDVDMIGESFDYSYVDRPTHISSLKKTESGLYESCFEKYFGGVVIFSNDIFLKINGFSNQYWGWGCEDDDLRIRCKTFQIPIDRKICKYFTLPHKKNCEPVSYQKNYSTLVFNCKLPINDRIKKYTFDGLNNVANNIESQFLIEDKNYTLIKIKTKI